MGQFCLFESVFEVQVRRRNPYLRVGLGLDTHANKDPVHLTTQSLFKKEKFCQIYMFYHTVPYVYVIRSFLDISHDLATGTYE